MSADTRQYDLFCFTCGYNLRGLTGDPLRCPECFYLNPVGDLEVSAREIATQLRLLESAPAGCLVCILMLGLVLWGWAVALLNHATNASFLLVLALVFTGLWLWSAHRFRETCRRRSQWKSALLRYHFYGLGLVLTMLMSGAAAIFLLAQIPTSSSARKVVLLLLAAALIFGFVMAVPPGYRSARRTMEPLQRDVAVLTARDWRRRRLAWRMRRQQAGAPS